MAGKIEFNRITNANIYINGNSLLGRAAKVKLPEITVTTTEHKALGMIGKIELPAGFEKMEGEINWYSFYKDVAKTTANPFKSVAMMCRSNLETYAEGGRTKEIPLVTFLTVMFKKNPLGEFEQQTNAEFSSAFNATYIKQVVDGVDVLELDFLANIFKIDGQDMMSTYRNNIGG